PRGPLPYRRLARPVPARTTLAPAQPLAGLLRLERHHRPLRRGPHHLPGLRDLELGLGPRGRRLLLAPLLLPSTRPELRQPACPRGHAAGGRLLVRNRGRRAAPRRRALSLRTRRDDVREPARDTRLPQRVARP